VVKVWRRTETGEAPRVPNAAAALGAPPRRQGATTENTGGI